MVKVKRKRVGLLGVTLEINNVELFTDYGIWLPVSTPTNFEELSCSWIRLNSWNEYMFLLSTLTLKIDHFSCVTLGLVVW